MAILTGDDLSLEITRSPADNRDWSYAVVRFLASGNDSDGDAELDPEDSSSAPAIIGVYGASWFGSGSLLVDLDACLRKDKPMVWQGTETSITLVIVPGSWSAGDIVYPKHQTRRRKATPDDVYTVIGEPGEWNWGQDCNPLIGELMVLVMHVKRDALAAFYQKLVSEFSVNWSSPEQNGEMSRALKS